MREEDKKLIDGLLNHDKTVGDDFYKVCEPIIYYVLDHYYGNIRNAAYLKEELAHEFYLYVMEHPEILLKFKGTCRLSSYLYSVGKNYFSSHRFDMDPALKEAKKDSKKQEEKAKKIIRLFDKDEIFAPMGTPAHNANEFRDEDEEAEEEFFYAKIDKEEDENGIDGDNEESVDNGDSDETDVIVNIDEIIDLPQDETTSLKCELVRQTLAHIHPKQAKVLEMQYFNGYNEEKIAKELGITIGTLYNLKSKAIKSFTACFYNLRKQYNEEN